jgi:hypothetical protein
LFRGPADRSRLSKFTLPREGFERTGGRTADPSTSLRFGRDDKGRAVTQVGVVSGMGRNTRPSTALPWISCGEWWRQKGKRQIFDGLRPVLVNPRTLVRTWGTRKEWMTKPCFILSWAGKSQSSHCEAACYRRLRMLPPSIPHTEEVTKEARSLARKTMTLATSSGSPSRCRGS